MPQFINDNYLWLSIIAVVLMLAIIGYIAEKNGFGTNAKKKDKKETNKENELENKITDETTPVQDEIISFENSEEPEKNDEPIDISAELEDEPIDNSNEETIEEPTVEPVEEANEVNSEEPTVEPVEEANEVNTEEPTVEPVEEVNEVSTEEPAVEKIETPVINNEEDLYAPFGDQEFNQDLNIDQDFNKILDDVDEATKLADSKESTPNTEEEDIWKF